MGTNSAMYLSRITCVCKIRNLSICTSHAKLAPGILFSPKLHNIPPEKQMSLKVNCSATASGFTAETAALKPLGLISRRWAAQGRLPAQKWTHDSEVSPRKMPHDLWGPEWCWDACHLVLVRPQVQHFQGCTRQSAQGLPGKAQTCLRFCFGLVFFWTLGSTLDNHKDFIDELICKVRGSFSTRWYDQVQKGTLWHQDARCNAAGASTPTGTFWSDKSSAWRMVAPAPLCHWARPCTSSEHSYADSFLCLTAPVLKKIKTRGNFFWP